MNPKLRARVGAAALLTFGVVALTGCADGFTGKKDAPASVAVDNDDPSYSDPTYGPDDAASSSTPESAAPKATIPSDPTTITCGEFSELSEEDQVTVLQELGSQATGEQLETAASLMSIGCRAFPDTLLTDALNGDIPE